VTDQETAQLSTVSVAYAAMFYVAAVIFLGGLGWRLFKVFSQPPHLRKPQTERPSPRVAATVRAATDVLFFRSTFFNDRIMWLCSACLHFGLLLVILRHLRYALDPNWVGPYVWKVVVLAQMPGLYGGAVFYVGVVGFWLRRIVIAEERAKTSLTDHLLFALMAAIPVVGYLNLWVHTDVVAVKEFFVGMVTFDLKPLPTDALLLTHLWLVALLLVTLPFTKFMHMAGVFDEMEKKLLSEPVHSNRGRLAAAAVIGLALLAPAGIGVASVLDQGWTVPQPDFSKLARAHKKDDPTVMIRNHPNFLMGHRSVVVYKGIRQEINTIEKCVDCHAVKGADGKPVGYDDPKHFCGECHNKAAVNIDCFECHNSKGPSDKDSLLEVPRRFAMRTPGAGEGSVRR